MTINTSSKTRTTVLSKEGKYLGERCVMYDRSRRVYVDFSCAGETDTRVWAWSGTPAQARRAREQFNIPDSFVLYPDGKEKGGV